MGCNVESAGGPSSATIKQKVGDATTAVSPALESRFEVGKSSDAYLMQSIMPLHSSISQSATSLFPRGLYPEVESAGRLAVVKELKEYVESQKQTIQEDITNAFALVEWLVEMQEIKDALLTYFTIPSKDDRNDVLAYLTNGVYPTGSDETSRQLTMQFELFRALIMITTKPWDAARMQYQKTVIDNGLELRASIERLGRAAAISTSIQDDVVIPRDANPVEIGVNMFKWGVAALAVLSGVSGNPLNAGQTRPNDVWFRMLDAIKDSKNKYPLGNPLEFERNILNAFPNLSPGEQNSVTSMLKDLAALRNAPIRSGLGNEKFEYTPEEQQEIKKKFLDIQYWGDYYVKKWIDEFNGGQDPQDALQLKLMQSAVINATMTRTATRPSQVEVHDVLRYFRMLDENKWYQNSIISQKEVEEQKQLVANQYEIDKGNNIPFPGMVELDLQPPPPPPPSPPPPLDPPPPLEPIPPPAGPSRSPIPEPDVDMYEETEGGDFVHESDPSRRASSDNDGNTVFTEEAVNPPSDAPSDTPQSEPGVANTDGQVPEETRNEWKGLFEILKNAAAAAALDKLKNAALQKFVSNMIQDYSSTEEELTEGASVFEKSDYCDTPYDTIDADSQEQVELGLAAATMALTEFEGRLEPLMAPIPNGVVSRLSNVSPYWNGHTKSKVVPPGEPGTSDGDWWAEKLLTSPNRPDRAVDVANLPEQLDAGIGQNLINAQVRARANTKNKAKQSMRYAVARGLCAYRAPTHKHPSNTTQNQPLIDKRGYLMEMPSKLGKDADPVLIYSLPAASAVPKNLKRLGPSDGATDQEKEMGNRLLFPMIDIEDELIEDFAQLKSLPITESGDIYKDVARPALWAPVSFEKEMREPDVTDYLPQNRLRCRLMQDEYQSKYDGNSKTFSDKVDAAQQTSHAAVLEHLMDYYARVATDKSMASKKRKFALLARGATKMEQLHSLLKTVAYKNRLEFKVHEKGSTTLQKRRGEAGAADNEMDVTLVTRPCLRCPDAKGGRVLFPVDAGMAMMASQVNAYKALRSGENLPGGGIYTIPIRPAPTEATLQAQNPNDVVREMHNAEAESIRFTDDRSIARGAATVGLRTALGKFRDQDLAGPGSARFAPLYVAPPTAHTQVFWSQSSKVEDRGFTSSQVTKTPEDFTVDNLRATFRMGIKMIDDLKQLECEELYLDEQIKQLSTGTTDDGTTADEQVAQQRRGAVYNDALREAALNGDRLYTFAQMLSGIIAETVEAVAVIDDSSMVREQREVRDRRKAAAQRAAEAHMQIVRSVFGAVLRDSGLKVGLDQDGSGLTVLNTTLQKQAQELTQRPVGDGFFANSIRLDELLTKGQGDISLAKLFDNLKTVAQELQKASESFIPVDSSASSMSLEFLRAPRNCLFLQWKNEARAAIRRAYDLFTNEMRKHGHMMRTISAYELIEGNDHELCNCFAEFCGQYMAMTRMQNPNAIAYISQSASTIATRKVAIALHRLVNAACLYVTRTGPPASNRKAYFDGLGPVYFAPPPRQRLPFRGGWGAAYRGQTFGS